MYLMQIHTRLSWILVLLSNQNKENLTLVWSAKSLTQSNIWSTGRWFIIHLHLVSLFVLRPCVDYWLQKRIKSQLLTYFLCFWGFWHFRSNILMEGLWSFTFNLYSLDILCFFTVCYISKMVKESSGIFIFLIIYLTSVPILGGILGRYQTWTRNIPWWDVSPL